MKKFTTILFLVIIVFCSIVYYLTFSYKVNIDATFTINNGDSIPVISKNLKNKKFISSDFLFKTYYKIFVKDTIKSGNHILFGSYTIPEIAEVITTPIKGEELKTQKLTIPEGWNKYKIATYLSERTDNSYDFILDYINSDYKNGILYEKYDFLQNDMIVSLEGFLYPDTYEVYENASLETILSKMLDNFNEKVIKKYSLEDKNKLYEILKVASIIEKEAKLDEDRVYVASVIYNRLDIGMRLEMDSTVVYFSQDANNVANDRKLDNEFNTYKNSGLPAGPIANPGDKSINAAINPARSNYIYFVTDSKGKAVFAKTYEEHERNIRKYLY